MAQTDGDTIIEEKIDEPPLYRVLMHNDDKTTMQFVVDIICNVFNKNREEAYELMLRVHEHGLAIIGVYPREIAETKISRVHHAAYRAGFPLRCTMEKD